MMKKLILAALMMVLSIFGANDIWAQSKNTANFTSTGNSEKKVFRPSVEKRSSQLKKELDLDNEQVAAVSQLLKDHFEKAAAIKAKKQGKENFIEDVQLKAARMRFQRELKSILNKEQRKKLEAFKDKRKEERRFAENKQ